MYGDMEKDYHEARKERGFLGLSLRAWRSWWFRKSPCPGVSVVKG